MPKRRPTRQRAQSSSDSDEEVTLESDSDSSPSDVPIEEEDLIEVSNEEPPKTEEELLLGDPIQQILGMREKDGKYYVKWLHQSYIHCSWEDEAKILESPGGRRQLSKYTKNKSKLTQSMSIPDLLTLGDEDVNTSWWEVDRVIGENDGLFLVKWKNLDYDLCSWEKESDLPADKIVLYRQRQSNLNPTRIKNPRDVLPADFAQFDTPITNPSGMALRPYQLEGVNYLRYCWYNRRNSILADEMGLGKTVQIVCALKDIYENHGIHGPFLVLAPLSTLHHWQNEFNNWSKMNAIIYHGNSDAKAILNDYEVYHFFDNDERDNDNIKFDVLITNYETVNSDFELFQSIQWRYLVLDEGHRLKNHEGKVYKLLTQITFEHCTLLTGTPIQNNAEELWSLLHFLSPQKFSDLSSFMKDYGSIEDADTLTRLRSLIDPYILRRKKSDVEASIAPKEETIIEVELTRAQKMYYRTLLSDNSGTLMQQITGGALPSLMNLMMQLRKVCNHPFLINGAMDYIESMTRKQLGENASDEEVNLRSLVDSSGKLILIDKLLPKLKADGHKVLIFSQMVKVLDILEDYMNIMEYPTERIDGSVAENDRQMAIERFGADPNSFVFLLCTRAGGVGINLTAADTVIIYDSDWNPQNDIQAQSRCHRIGQTSKVKVYRLVTRGTYELEMLDRASKKLGLDKAILDGGQLDNTPLQPSEIEKLLRCGVYNIANDDDSEIEKFCAADIESILGERSKSFTEETTDSGSLFSKAKFDTGEDEMDSTEFWKNVMPQVEKHVEQNLTVRRCRLEKELKKTKNSDESDSGSDDGGDDGEADEEKRARRKKNGSISWRGIWQYLTHHGYTNDPYQHCLIYTVVKKHEPMPEDAIEDFCKVLGVSVRDVPPSYPEFENLLKVTIDSIDGSIDILRARLVLFWKIGLILNWLQKPIDTYPGTSSNEDSYSDYAFLYGFYFNGLSDANGIYEGIKDQQGNIQPLNENNALKIAQSITEDLFPLVTPDDQPISNDNIVTPETWRENHPNLFNRSDLTNSEVASLFNTMALFGFNMVDGEIDWKEIAREARLFCVTEDAVIEQAQQIERLARNDLKSEEQNYLMGRLGKDGGKIMVKHLKSNLRDLTRIRNFVKTIGEDEEALIATMHKWDCAPEWWETKHDLALIRAIAKYGAMYLLRWIVEEPFVSHIPENCRESYLNCAAQETSTGRITKPKEVSEFNFLFNEKLRIGRAVAIEQFVETRMQRQRRAESTPDYDCREVLVYDEMPEVPFEICQALVVLDFGRFINYNDIYPAGYRCKRQYFSLLDPNEKEWFIAETRLNSKGKLDFAVFPEDRPNEEFLYHTSSGAWERMIQALQTVRGKFGLPKRKHTSVSGPFMYGFSTPQVTAAFQFMKKGMDVEAASSTETTAAPPERKRRKKKAKGKKFSSTSSENEDSDQAAE